MRRAGASHRWMHLAMVLVTACWAGNLVAGKKALTGFGPVALTQLRVLVVAALYGVVWIAYPRRPRLRLTLRQWGFMALIALNGVTLNQLLYIEGVARTSVAQAGLIVAIGPVMVLVLACLLRLESLTLLKFAGMLISFGGVGILTAGKTGNVSAGYWAGDLILLGSSAVFAYFTILVKQVADQFDALTLNTLVFGLGALMLVPFGTLAVRKVYWQAVAAPAWWGLAFMIVLGAVIPYLLFAWALRGLAASRVAAFGYLQPVIATSLGIWFLAERLTLKLVVGGAIILLGVYLTERERSERKTVGGW
jgi:drug/metabolite transporter (DMT)-like permease